MARSKQAKQQAVTQGPKRWSNTAGTLQALLEAVLQTRAYKSPNGEMTKRHDALLALVAQYRDHKHPAGFEIGRGTLEKTIDSEIADFKRTDGLRTARSEQVERLLTQVEAIGKENEFEKQKRFDENEQRKRERTQIHMLHDLTKGKATRGLDPEMIGRKRAKPQKLPDTPDEGAILFLPNGVMDTLDEFKTDMQTAETESQKKQAEFMSNMTNMMAGMLAIQRDLANSMKDVLAAVKDK